MPARRLALLVAALLAAWTTPATAGRFAKSDVPRPARAYSYSALERYDYAIVAAKPGLASKLALAASGGRVVSPSLGIWRVRSRATRDVVRRLRVLGALRYVEPDRPVYESTHLTHGDPLVAPELAWHLYRIGVDQVESPGPGVPITVLDAGLDMNHVEFRTRPNTVLLNPQDVPSTVAAEYHGTFVASTAAAPADGVGTVGVYADAVLRSYDIRIFTDSAIVAALELAVQAGTPTVINLSFGGPEPSEALHEAVLRAFAAGAIIVASSGNDFLRGDPLNYPAGYPHVLTVAATDRQDAPAFFSSSGAAVDVAAPGEGIPFQHPTDTSYRFLTGTSFSAPIVTAAAAWLWTARPELDKTQVIELLRSSARDLAPAGFDSRTGFGVIDLPAALTRPAPILDPQEPNDDISQVVGGAVFPRPKRLLTTRRKPNTRLRARLERSEDPDDVYRVLVPAGRRISVTIRTDGDIGATLWNPRAKSVLRNTPSARRDWLAVSNRPGKRTETLVYRNESKSAIVAFLDVWLPTKSASRTVTYAASIKTTR